jgi:prepilin-type N-terminal cleavage/methylation domain-containing protein
MKRPNPDILGHRSRIEYEPAGYSLVEIAIVLLIISVILGFALLNISAILPGMNADGALGQTVGQLRKGRELAIAQRRTIELKFIGTNQIQLVRQDVPSGTTVLSTETLEGRLEFLLFSGLPDSPDLFGRNAAVDFGSATRYFFQSDGTLVDTAGDPINGSIFLGIAAHAETARAATVLGSTGRVRDYRWNGSAWIH